VSSKRRESAMRDRGARTREVDNATTSYVRIISHATGHIPAVTFIEGRTIRIWPANRRIKDRHNQIYATAARLRTQVSAGDLRSTAHCGPFSRES